MYLGFARGGVYKTTDGGASWSSIFDEFTYLSVSDIRIDPNNSDIIYIGTGDENISHYPGVGNGIYRSMNGGDSWEHLGLGEESIISDIRLATDGSIYAGAMGLPFERSSDRGLYKSTDNGERWSQVLFIDDSTGIIDLEIPTDNPDLIYAAGWTRIRSNNFSRVAGPGSAIYRSRDGGENWDKLGSENGLPEGEFVRIGLDLFGNDGQTIFATLIQRTQKIILTAIVVVLVLSDFTNLLMEVITGSEFLLKKTTILTVTSKEDLLGTLESWRSIQRMKMTSPS